MIETYHPTQFLITFSHLQFIHKDHPKALYLFLLISALSTLSFFLSKALAAPETPLLVHLAFAALGWSLLTALALFFVDCLYLLAESIMRAILARPPILAEVAKSRRKVAVALLLSSCMALVGLMEGARAPEVVYTRVSLERFPCSMNGFTIVQVSGMYLCGHKTIRKKIREKKTRQERQKEKVNSQLLISKKRTRKEIEK